MAADVLALGADDIASEKSTAQEPNETSAARREIAREITQGKRALFWVKPVFWCLGLAMAIYAFSRVPLGHIGEVCMQLGPMVALSPLLAIGWFSANAAGLGHLLRRPVPLRVLLYNRLMGECFNSLIPAGGVGGEPFKANHLAGYVSLSEAISTLLWGRMAENVAGLLFSATAVGLGLALCDVPEPWHTILLLYAVGAWLGAMVIFAVAQTRLVGLVGQKISSWVGDTAARGEILPRKIFVGSIGYFLLGRFLGLLEILLLFHLLDLPIHFHSTVLILGTLGAAGFVGFMFPQGLGFTEAATVQIFAVLGYSPSAAVGFALARRGRMLLMNALGVSLYFSATKWSERSAKMVRLPPR